MLINKKTTKVLRRCYCLVECNLTLYAVNKPRVFDSVVKVRAIEHMDRLYAGLPKTPVSVYDKSKMKCQNTRIIILTVGV